MTKERKKSRKDLIKEHGTLAEFTEAVRRAIGEISVLEAFEAAEKYKKELEDVT